MTKGSRDVNARLSEHTSSAGVPGEPLAGSAMTLPEDRSFTLANPSSPEDFAAYYELRWQVLRAPWNQPRGSEQDALESQSMHWLARDIHGAVIGAGRLHFLGPQEAQIRYMAVAETWRGRGVGRALLAALERRAGECGACRIILNARENALGFYRSAGYRPEAEVDTLFGVIRHWRMSKTLRLPDSTAQAGLPADWR
jgi:ribosomal protein S18 acetylase RimI-like enzyme